MQRPVPIRNHRISEVKQKVNSTLKHVTRRIKENEAKNIRHRAHNNSGEKAINRELIVIRVLLGEILRSLEKIS